jgi:hypothetical protein
MLGSNQNMVVVIQEKINKNFDPIDGPKALLEPCLGRACIVDAGVFTITNTKCQNGIICITEAKDWNKGQDWNSPGPIVSPNLVESIVKSMIATRKTQITVIIVVIENSWDMI